MVALLPLLLAMAPVPELRVCADPNNLPFSDARGRGLENALARLVARDLGRRLVYVWQPQRRGFVRHTLGAHACDVMMEVPGGFELALATRPYYRSSYVFVSRRDRRLGLRSLDDPRLRTLRIGVQIVGTDYASTPPAYALVRRGLQANVVGFSVLGNYADAVPLAPIVSAVERGEVDLALVWGPLAGWMARSSKVPLTVAPVTPAEEPPFSYQFDMSMGVRKGDLALRDALDGIIVRRRQEIDSILRRFGVPRVGSSP